MKTGIFLHPTYGPTYGPSYGLACDPCGNVNCAIYGCQKHKNQPQHVVVAAPYPLPPKGCICPPTSEQTCQSELCPRKTIYGANP